MATYDYDLITIGAGSGGVRASRMSAGYGAHAAVIENNRFGGTCVMRGCVPKKLLVYGSQFSDEFKDARGFGWTTGELAFDWAQLIANKNRELDRLEEVYRRMLRESGVTMIEGTGLLADAHTVEVGGRAMTAEHILLAAGGWPTMPDIPGIEHVITSNEALDLERLPARLVIVGGGYIAVEFAGIFNALGVEVTEILRADTVLRGFDEDMRLALAEEMRKRGVNLRCESVVRGIEKENDAYSLRLAGGYIVEADLVMYATGRAPRTKGLGLEAAGVELDGKGAVVVDEFSRTSQPNILAIGDITNRLNLTPVAIAEGQALAESLFNSNPTTANLTGVPTAVFSQPPLATIGLSEDEARAQFADVDVYLSSFRPLKHTLSGRDEMTVMKLVVDAESDRVLGCHMVGLDAAEIIQGLGVALKCGATKAQFDATVGIHPTAAEEFVTMRGKRPAHAARKAG
ncbi:MAG: glutathione-disulfide reductase [Rhodospirillales bacterium]|jgi:glutathione reductase (NADPH)|nr:glutathione-disulfide reductase [Rhodospirillales bacterium]HJO73116.1 glutathione-disulfide reductase [Rhodospirillales bacterium]